MSEHQVSDDHRLEAPVTAAQIAENCPAELCQLGKRINAHLEKAAQHDAKAQNHRVSAGLLLAQAKEACDEGGFTAFRERFCPDLGKSRAYELLAIASGRKTVEQIRADNAERNRQLRARKKAEVVVRHVTDSATRPPTTALQIARAEAQKARAEAVARMFPVAAANGIPGASREALIRAMHRLAAENVNERAEAAVAVERERTRLGMTWDELIVPAVPETERQAA